MRPNQVTIVGAGIVGSSCAWHLQRKGFTVTMVDPVPPGQSTSFGNAGCISPSNIIPFSHPGVLKELPQWLLKKNSPLVIRWRQLPRLLPWLLAFRRSGRPAALQRAIAAIAALMDPARRDWERILQATGGQRYKRAGGVIKLYDSEAHFRSVRWQYEIQAEHGYTHRRISEEELAQLEPDLRLPNTTLAVHCPDWELITDPGGVSGHIAANVLAAGGDWVQDKVDSIQRQGDRWQLKLASGAKASTDYLVIAAGVWSNALAAQLDQVIPMAPKRGYHVCLNRAGVQVNHPIMFVRDYFILAPMDMGIRLAGTAEFDVLDAPPDYRRASMLVDKARPYFPALRPEPGEPWMGQRPMTPDSAPVIGPSPTQAKVYYAFGHGHYGLTQGPTSGRIIAEMISGEAQQPAAIRSLGIQRFI